MNKLTLHAQTKRGTINRHVYGHFAEHLGRCIYEGIWVGEDSPIPNVRGIRTDTVAALRKLNIPNLRWPGGCFADAYHWRDGIGPRSQRPRTINLWGDAPETNHFGTHEFMDLCQQLRCAPYIAGNVGSGTVQEMRDWVEYLTSDYDSSLTHERQRNGQAEAWSIPFWGIGNENWGCGGHMTPEHYADVYCQYHTHVKNYGKLPMLKFASGLGGSDTDGEGNDRLLQHIYGRRHPVTTDGISLHYYVYLPNQPEHSATAFGTAEWFTVLKAAHDIGAVIERTAAVMDSYDPDKHLWLVVDEWGTWYPAEAGTNPAFLYQQNSMRDAVAAAVTLHLFHDHCDRVQMANIAQTVNVLQAMILTEGEKFLLTPTYHVFEMFKQHQGAAALQLDIDGQTFSHESQSLPMISASASQPAAGGVLLTVCNLHPSESAAVDCACRDMAVATAAGRILVGDAITAHNTFADPERVHPVPFEHVQITDVGHLRFELPPAAVLALTLT